MKLNVTVSNSIFVSRNNCIYRFLVSLCMVMTFFACQKDKVEDDVIKDNHTELQLNAEVVKSTIYSRATDTAFEDEDKIGVFIVKNSGEEILQALGNYIDNRLFTFHSSENSWNTSPIIYYVTYPNFGKFLKIKKNYKDVDLKKVLY